MFSTCNKKLNLRRPGYEILLCVFERPVDPGKVSPEIEMGCALRSQSQSPGGSGTLAATPAFPLRKRIADVRKGVGDRLCNPVHARNQGKTNQSAKHRILNQVLTIMVVDKTLKLHVLFQNDAIHSISSQWIFRLVPASSLHCFFTFRHPLKTNEQTAFESDFFRSFTAPGLKICTIAESELSPIHPAHFPQRR